MTEHSKPLLRPYSSAQIIADSISEARVRLTTMQLRYPRFVHAELMTHRVFSRNASSSRAIPVERLIKDVLQDTAMPLHWGKNQPGMQAKEECNELVDINEKDDLTRENAWFKARDNAIQMAKAFNKAGYHKQIVNRLLEPFSHINVVVTATEWENFFTLRDHPDAQPEIMVLAQEMKKAMKESKPNLLLKEMFHLPYIVGTDDWYIPQQIALKCSVARCARVSYLTHDQKPPIIENDLKLYDQLITSKPSHASPCEHQATPDEHDGVAFKGLYHWKNSHLHGNFKGWQQYRKILGM